MKVNVVNNFVSQRLAAGQHAGLIAAAEKAIFSPVGSISAQIRKEVVAVIASTYGYYGGNLPGTTSEKLLAEICRLPKSNLWKEVKDRVAEEIKLLEQN
jgi:hypothetical protein